MDRRDDERLSSGTLSKPVTPQLLSLRSVSKPYDRIERKVAALEDGTDLNDWPARTTIAAPPPRPDILLEIGCVAET